MKQANVKKDFEKGMERAERREEMKREFKSRETADRKRPLRGDGKGKNITRTVKKPTTKLDAFEMAYQKNGGK